MVEVSRTYGGDVDPDAPNSNLLGAAAPTVNDDLSEGFEPGSRWMDLTGDQAYVCLDNTEGAAVWIETSAGAGGGISNIVEDATPQLGGPLDLNGKIITDLHNQMDLDQIDAPTYHTLQQRLSAMHSAGWVAGGVITDDADGTISISAGQGLIRATDSDVAPLLAFDWAAEAGANVALVDADMNYIYVEYAAGSPQLIATNVKRTDHNTNVYLGSIYRDDTRLHLTPNTKIQVSDHAAHMVARAIATDPFAHISGGILTGAGTRNIVVSAGDWYEGLTNFQTPEIDTSATGVFVAFYRDGIGGWTRVDDETQISNTEYDDSDGVLGLLTGSKYGVHWLFVGQDNDVYSVYGRGDYTLAQAQDADIPADLPPHFAENHVKLVGKIIVQKDSASFESVESAFDIAFIGGVPSTLFASIAETNVGNNSTKAVTPDGLAGSNFGTRIIQMPVVEWDTDHTTGDGKFHFNVPEELAGMNIIGVRASLITAGVTGLLTVQLRNVTQADAAILSTPITVDTNELSSETAATPPVIDVAEDDLTDDDTIAVDIDGIHSGTAGRGLIITIAARLP